MTVLSMDSFFHQKQDCCGHLRASSDQKLCAALRILSTGAAADTLVDYFRLSETLLLDTMRRFCKTLIAAFGDEYLRRPTASDISSIQRDFAELGFPGCLGAVDCSRWQWNNCPAGYQGQYIGKEGKPCIRLEVVSDDQFWIWHVMFGVPGARNDISIVNQSTFFNDIRSGKWPPVKPSLNIGGTVITWFYFLADEIYPRFRIFAKPHPNPSTVKEKLYTRSHCSARKGVERVLQFYTGSFKF